MSDPLDKLASFDPGPAMSPLPPSEVRRRGDRARRRHTALVVGGAVAAVVLVVTPIAVLANRDGGGKTQPAGPVLSEEVLLTADEVPGRERLTPWREADPQGPVLACAPDSASLDGESSVRRDFDADIAGAPAGDLPASVVRTEVLEFTDDAAARAGYETALGWITDCPGAEDSVARGGTAQSKFDLDGGGQGEWRPHIFSAPEFCGGGDCDAALFDRMGVAQFDDRLVLVSLAEVGGPLEPDGLDGTMDELFQAAVTKAGGEITGGSSAVSESVGPEPAGPGIPDEFPLATGWPEPDNDNEITGPDRGEDPVELSVCDVVVPDAAHTDRMRADYSAPEDYRTRQLTTYDDADAAVAAVTSIVDAFRACPQDSVDEAGYVTHHDVQRLDVGDESWAILARDTFDGSDTPFGATTIIVRVGSAVLVLDHGGHGGYPSGNGQAGVETTLTEASVPIAEMCVFAVAGCGG
jgi:hypothetical protein